MTTEQKEVSRLSLAVLEALAIAGLPEAHWIYGDDLCDCEFPRIGHWSNPYTARTLRVRLCCIWAEVYKQYPQFVQEIPASYDSNRHQWQPTPEPWDSEDMKMPVFLWFRQLAAKTGLPLSEIRKRYADRLDERPKKVKRGMGRPQPTEEEVKVAHMERLRLGGWL